jgi:hypothetical protein
MSEKKPLRHDLIFDIIFEAMTKELEEELSGRLGTPEGFLEEHVMNGSMLSTQVVDEKMQRRLVRHLEAHFGVKQDDGYCLSIKFDKWLSSTRLSEIDFYYWRRLDNFWRKTAALPKDVVRSVDEVTQEVLGLFGDPQDKSNWQRRGLVMGHVQSGKTTNYSALITKAADAGYRIIIVLSGLTNSLRLQTQERLDKTFVGKASISDGLSHKMYPVSKFHPENVPVRSPYCGTTQHNDFNSEKAKGSISLEGTYAEPVLFVTKKHPRVLEELLNWLKGLNPGGKLDGPMLIIDDEADNGSIDTAKDTQRATRINELIGQLLESCARSTYVGYTATPFANIFIEPDTKKDMESHPLFPRDFIKALDAPDNYIGAQKLFDISHPLSEICIKDLDSSDGSKKSDYIDLLPLNHKSTDPVNELPLSLIKAIQVFILFRCIRILNNEASKHTSMLINVSRFNAIQKQVYEHVELYVNSVRDSARTWAKSDYWNKSQLLMALHETWMSEYQKTVPYDWKDILNTLYMSLIPVEPRLVNMSGGKLDYSKSSDEGMHIIAIGGLALARGLTLEGLAVSYVLRNPGASDTLLQIGRWFGYREGYAELCRIYLTNEMIEHFREVNLNVEELREDLKRMVALEMTPYDFGLKVRQSDTGIAITAANKMRSAKPVELSADYAEKHKQAFKITNDKRINENNLSAVLEFSRKLNKKYGDKYCKEESSALVWTGVDATDILNLISSFNLPQLEFIQMQDGHSLISDFIRDRSRDEWPQWDVAIPHKSTKWLDGLEKLVLPVEVPNGDLLYCRQRVNAYVDMNDTATIKFTNKNVVADKAEKDLVYCMSHEKTSNLIDENTAKGDKKLPLEKVLLRARDRPLLIIHLVQLRLANNEKNKGINLDFDETKPVVSLSLAFPSSNTPVKGHTYAATSRLVALMEEQRQQEKDDDVIEDE